MAIDEAHLLKNRESKRFKELATFRTRYRLLLSGTPLHNNLEEVKTYSFKNINSFFLTILILYRFKISRYESVLGGINLDMNQMWSLLHFLSPDLYRDVDEFKRKFSEIEKCDSVGELKEKQLTQLQVTPYFVLFFGSIPFITYSFSASRLLILYLLILYLLMLYLLMLYLFLRKTCMS